MPARSIEISREIQSYIATRRVAHLATTDAAGAPHVIPICYAFDGQHLYSALDKKPKQVVGNRLKRMRNIIDDPRVAIVIDDYSEIWEELCYVLVRGEARILVSGAIRDRAEAMLRDKYPQYHEMLAPGCIVLQITPRRVTSWRANAKEPFPGR